MLIKTEFYFFTTQVMIKSEGNIHSFFYFFLSVNSARSKAAPFHHPDLQYAGGTGDRLKNGLLIMMIVVILLQQCLDLVPDKASDFGSEDSRFESWRGRRYF